MVAAAYAGRSDPWEAFEAGCRAFVEGCQEPGIQRICLLDAPAALDWDEMREIESGSMERWCAESRGRTRRAGSRRAILAASPTCSSAGCSDRMVVDRAPDQRGALQDAVDELGAVLRALAVPRPIRSEA